MIKPTKHYEELRQGLQGYRRDEDYLTLEDCVAHILLDVRVWARSHGLSLGSLKHVYLRALGMEMCQLEQGMRVAKRGLEAKLREKSVKLTREVACCATCSFGYSCNKRRINVRPYLICNDYVITKDEFEALYAKRSETTVARLHELGRTAMSCDCGEENRQGWQMTHQEH